MKMASLPSLAFVTVLCIMAAAVAGTLPVCNDLHESAAIHFLNDGTRIVSHKQYSCCQSAISHSPALLIVK